MSTAGIIFSNLHDANIPELTRMRTMASVPFLCRYRLIDFALSNMVNSDITNISVITHYNYHSLMDHIGSGKDWDLARRSGGVKILPPYITAYANNAEALYNTRLEALKNIIFSISRIPEDYVVMSDCDTICNVDLSEIVDNHIASGADITIAAKKMNVTRESAAKSVIFESNKDGVLTDIFMQPANVTGLKDVSLNITVIARQLLESLLYDAIAHDYTSFNRDIIARNISHKNIRIYRYDGFFAKVSSFSEYFSHSMDLVSSEIHRDELFANKNRPIFTKVRNSAPTTYSDSCQIKNSLIADGCHIDGVVENSVLFRGVKVGKNSVVRNSILFQDAQIGEYASLNCVVSDKNTTIRDRRDLSGHTTLPFYIAKGTIV